MQANYWILHFVFILLPYGMLLALLSSTALGYKPEPQKILAIGIIQALISSFISFNSECTNGIAIVVQLVSLAMVITIVLKLPLKKGIEATLISIGAWGMLELITAPILLPLTEIYSHPQNIWVDISFFLPKGVICACIIQILYKRSHRKFITYFIKKLHISNFQKPDSFSKYQSFLIQLIIAQTILIVGLVLASYYDVFNPIRGHFRGTVSLVLMTFIVVYASFTYIFVKRINVLIREGIQSKLRFESFEQIGDLLKVVDIQRHNFKHDLHVIHGLLEVSAFQEASTYVRRIVLEVRNTSEIIQTDNTIITALLKANAEIAETQNIQFVVEVTASFAELPIQDRDAILILGNLIDNAFDAVASVSPERKLVEVGLHRNLESYIFEVKNCGPPLDLEQKKKIFLPEYTTKNTGSGLGLYSVQRLVKKYQGKIDIFSNEDLTSFTVYLPESINNGE